MIGALASVQTAADSAPLTFGQVLVALAAVAILWIVVASPAIYREWRRARHVIREMPMPTQRANVPQPREEHAR